MHARLAEPDDIPQIVSGAEIFAQEAWWGFTFDPQKALDMIEAFMTHPLAALLVIDDGASTICAGALISLEPGFCVENFGHVGYFFVIPAYRRTRASRQLLQAIDDWMAAMGAAAVMAGGTANLSARESRQLTKLFRKAGYEVAGDALVKRSL